MDPKDYAPHARLKETYLGGVNVRLESGGGACCEKCGEVLPPKEMFCLACFGKYPEPKPRYRAPKLDDPGNMFDGL